MIYCSRCDKPLTPDHRCGVTRRVLFGLFAGAAAAAALPDCWGDVHNLRRGDIIPPGSTIFMSDGSLFPGGAGSPFLTLPGIRAIPARRVVECAGVEISGLQGFVTQRVTLNGMADGELSMFPPRRPFWMRE